MLLPPLRTRTGAAMALHPFVCTARLVSWLASLTGMFIPSLAPALLPPGDRARAHTAQLAAAGASRRCALALQRVVCIRAAGKYGSGVLFRYALGAGGDGETVFVATNRHVITTGGTGTAAEPTIAPAAAAAATASRLLVRLECGMTLVARVALCHAASVDLALLRLTPRTPRERERVAALWLSGCFVLGATPVAGGLASAKYVRDVVGCEVMLAGYASFGPGARAGCRVTRGRLQRVLVRCGDGVFSSDISSDDSRKYSSDGGSFGGGSGGGGEPCLLLCDAALAHGGSGGALFALESGRWLGVAACNVRRSGAGEMPHVALAVPVSLLPPVQSEPLVLPPAAYDACVLRAWALGV